MIGGEHGPDQGLRVFVSYRREDTAGHAGRLYDRLVERFGDGRVFMDVDAIRPGTDFEKVIDEALDQCDVLLALIGRVWLTSRDKNGRRRLDSPDDFVRMELEAALRRGIPVIPVLLQKADMPPREELPDSLAALTRWQALELSDHRWRTDTAELVDALERLERQKAPQHEGRAPPAVSAGQSAGDRGAPLSAPPRPARPRSLRPPHQRAGRPADQESKQGTVQRVAGPDPVARPVRPTAAGSKHPGPARGVTSRTTSTPRRRLEVLAYRLKGRSGALTLAAAAIVAVLSLALGLGGFSRFSNQQDAEIPCGAPFAPNQAWSDVSPCSGALQVRRLVAAGGCLVAVTLVGVVVVRSGPPGRRPGRNQPG